MNTVAARMVYENAMVNLAKAFQGTPGVNIAQFKTTQSFLRLEQAIAVGQTLYNFPVLINQANPTIFNTENRLNLQDSFVVSEIGFFLAAPSSSTDTTFRPMSYVNNVVFTNQAQMQSIYNGQLSVTVNNNVLVPTWDLTRHYVANQTQQTTALGAGAPGDQINLGQDGFYPMEPNLVIVGSKNYKFNITLAAPLTAITTNSRMVLILRGVLAQNSTVVS